MYASVPPAPEDATTTAVAVTAGATLMTDGAKYRHATLPVAAATAVTIDPAAQITSSPSGVKAGPPALAGPPSSTLHAVAPPGEIKMRFPATYAAT
jgi:hypothetical protein